jgi:serine/threonine protein kinase
MAPAALASLLAHPRVVHCTAAFLQGGSGFSARVADFGLSRTMSLTQSIVTQTTGTLTHMPPELIREGRMSLAADVYAFGVIMWWVRGHAVDLVCGWVWVGGFSERACVIMHGGELGSSGSWMETWGRRSQDSEGHACISKGEAGVCWFPEWRLLLCDSSVRFALMLVSLAGSW